MKLRIWIDTRTLAKTGSYWVVHVSIAALVGYAITRDLLAALTLSLVEPTVQAFAFFLHEKAWEHSRAGSPQGLLRRVVDSVRGARVF